MEAQKERGEACLRGEKINVEGWGKQEGRDDAFRAGLGLYMEPFYSHTYRGASYTHKEVMLKSGKERGTEDWVRHALFVVRVNAVCSSSGFLQIWGCFTSPACILPFTGGQKGLAHMCSLGINSRDPMRWTTWAICGATPFSFLSCSGLHEYIQIWPNCGFFDLQLTSQSTLWFAIKPKRRR